MAVLIPMIPPQTVEARPFGETEELAVAQGREAQQVRDQIETVSRHWRRQSTDAAVASEVDLLDELNEFRHVPFDRAGTRRVRYTRTRELLPRKIDFDEFDFDEEEE